MTAIDATTLCHALARNAQNHPDRPLVHHRGSEQTYGATWRQAQSLAQWLIELGLVAGDRVAILSENSPRYVTAYFGIQLAGGVVVALNPETTARELSQTLVHCEPFAVIAQRSSVDALVAVAPWLTTTRAVLILDPDDHPIHGVFPEIATWEGVVAETSSELSIDCRPDALAQIIYTSGTTGRPKGVMLSHANLLANCRSIVDVLGITAADRVLVVLPFYYSYGNSLLFTHVAVGGALILPLDFVFWNRVLDLLRDQGATGLAGVPTTYAMLFQRSKFGQVAFPSLRYLTCAGGALPAANVARLRECFPSVELYLMYGQTEATARLSTLAPCDLDRKAGSIGRGIPGVSLTIRDDAGRPVAAGEIGEISATGPNLMMGYWNDPEATSQVLTEHGLRTGDLGRIDEEGYVYVVGRNSDMIKQGAYRISPQEMEEVILEFPGISEAAVVGVADPILGEIAVAYVVASSPGNCPSADAITDHCRRLLPRHKQVKRVTFVDSLPRTSSGKVRRSALRDLGAPETR